MTSNQASSTESRRRLKMTNSEVLIFKFVYFIKLYRYCLLRRQIRLMNYIADIHRDQRLMRLMFNKMRQHVAKRREISKVCQELTSKPLTLCEFLLLPPNALKRIFAIQHDRLKLMRKYFQILCSNVRVVSNI